MMVTFYTLYTFYRAKGTKEISCVTVTGPIYDGAQINRRLVIGKWIAIKKNRKIGAAFASIKFFP